MAGIRTTREDGGQTGLAGGIRVSRAELRVEAYGSIDEGEGFAVVPDGDAPLTVSAEGASGWQASLDDRIVEGDSFAALAALVRALGNAANGETRT